MAFYRDLSAELCQGDLLNEMASVHVRSPVAALRKFTLPGGREVFKVFQRNEECTPPLDFLKDGGEDSPISCNLGRAIVITHDCDIDHERRYRLVAAIRPMDKLDEKAKTGIVNNANGNYFYLPADVERGIDEGYVDFRRITSITKTLLEQASRKASLAKESLRALQMCFFRFVTKRDIIE